jgi:hypothetical protein
MRRIIFLAGVLPFVSAFLGGILAVSWGPALVVEAQEGRIRAERVTVVGEAGTDRVSLRANPGGRAFVDVLSSEGVRRISAATGGEADPENADLLLYKPDGQTVVAGLVFGRGGTSEGPLTTQLIMRDLENRRRVVLRVDEDVTPSMVFLDAGGNVTWEAK